MRLGEFINRVGFRYGKLTVIKLAGKTKSKYFWTCKCDCGNIVDVVGCNLGNGHTRSCGCLNHKSGVESHSWKGGITNSGFYKRVLKQQPDHPKANKGYVLQYVLIVEKILGRYLRDKEIVHHVDGNPTNDKNSNLVVCENQKYHIFLHMRTRALKACGHANWIKCTYCKKYDNPDNMYIRKDRPEGWHQECSSNHMKFKYSQRKNNIL